MGQYPDGLRGALIIHDPSPPFQYDAEFTMTLTDWYHEQMPALLDEYQSRDNLENNHGWEPLPDVPLVNDMAAAKFKVEPNKTYLIRVICIGNWPGHAFIFDGHEATIVEVDGVFTEPYPAGTKNLRVATGQRMSVLLHTKNDTSRNYAIWDGMDENMMFAFANRTMPPNYHLNTTAWLVYDENKPLPPPPDLQVPNFVDDVDFVPTDKEPLLEPVDHQIIMDTTPANKNGVVRFLVNNQTYLPQKVPSLYTAMSMSPEYTENPEVYGQVNPFIVQYGDVVEIVVNNYHNNLHPWHLHGHQFQVLQRTDVDGGYFSGYFANVSSTPMKRDTIMVQNHGHAVIRFRATNPDMSPIPVRVNRY